MDKKILIVVDNSRRDLLPFKLLEKGFREKGVKAYICSKRDIKIMCRKIQPDACIMPRADWPITRDVAKCCRLYIVPSEGGRLTPQTMMSVFLGRTYKKENVEIQLDQYYQPISNFDFIKKVYLWGTDTRSFLLDTKHFRPEQLVVAGNGRLDIYRNTKTKKMGKIENNFTVGFAFSVKSTSYHNGKIEYAKELYNLDDRAKFPLVPPGRHWEDYAWRDFAILRRMMRIIKKIIKETDYKIYLRVGPLENINDYKFLEKINPERVKIQKRDGQLYDFLKNIDVLLTCWSTTGLEALLMDIPVIAIPFTIDYDFLVNHVDPKANGFDTFLCCYHTPRSEEEVFNLIEKTKKGLIDITPDRAYLKELLKNIYNFPSKESATRTVVEDIIQDLENYTPPSDEIYKIYLSFPKKSIEQILKIVPIPKQIIFIILQSIVYLRNLLSDLRSGVFSSVRETYSIHNSQVEQLVRKTIILKINQEE